MDPISIGLTLAKFVPDIVDLFGKNKGKDVNKTVEGVRR